jgi:hypothetical protein
MMMPEYDAEGRRPQGTLFNYNDNILNNIATFAANELGGFDDFQRAFGNFDRGDISFWDRLKAGATGVGELGTTAAMFIPGAGAAAALTKVPAAGKALSKTAPLLFPGSRAEGAAGLGSLAAIGGGSVAPEDSPLSAILPLVGGAGIAGLLGLRGVKAFRNRGKVPGTDLVPFSPSKSKGLLSFLPKSGRGRALTALIGILGLGGATGLGFMGGGSGDQAYVPTTAPGSAALTETRDPYAAALEILQGGSGRQQQIIEQARDSALQDFGSAEREQLERYLSGIGAITEAQTGAARQDYQALYDRLAGDVASIQGMGDEGASNVRSRYRQAASRAAREGRQEQVASGVGGLTPVSGDLADMPSAMRGQGADLSEYLRNNAAIAARDAGFDAETSLEYGNALANQFAQQMALMGEQQRYSSETSLAREERNTRAQYDAMIADLARQGIDAETQLALQQALEPDVSISAENLMLSPFRDQVLSLWAPIEKIMSGDTAGMSEGELKSARSSADYLNALYGNVSLESLAQFYADNPRLLSTSSGG